MELTALSAPVPIHIAGPCSAETREQVLSSAKGLLHLPISYFRAGIWKPRTRPDSFEGVGSPGLAWLSEVKDTYNIPIITEVATPNHVEEVLKIGIDAVWVGARTTVNPFSVQALAESLRGIDIPVFIKNPIHADLGLWIGAFERFFKENVRNLAAIHRGFASYGENYYRNKPLWQIPIELRRQFPDLTVLCDISHISGRREILTEVANEAMNIGFEGLMTEVHPNPKEAWSDAEQQITPKVFEKLLEKIQFRSSRGADYASTHVINEMRSEIDQIDRQLLTQLERRMELSEHIGQYKRHEDIPILQTERWNDMINRYQSKASELGLSKEFVIDLFRIIHQESIDHQQK